MLTQIKYCYTELYNFWTEEIFRATEAFKKRCVDWTDFERWSNFHASLKQTIESWKVQYGFLLPCCAILIDQNHTVQDELPSGDAQTVFCNNACLSRVCQFHFHFGIPLN